MRTESKFTLFFDDPYWVGVYERINGDNLEVARVVFGAEPKDYEVYDFMLRNFYNLKFSPLVEAGQAINTAKNPKRVQRQINHQLLETGIGTKAQQALKLQQKEGKKERQRITRENREAEAKLKFELKQQKKKEKHRGR